MSGLFLSMDGLDGTGKSTQCRLLATWLRAQGRTVTECRDPGGTPLGDQLRGLVLGHKHEMTLAAEAFLFMASRAELVYQVIRPALAAGHVVICDRFLLANIVYQGYAGGLPIDALYAMGRIATGGLEPDLTIVFDMPVALALGRRGGNADRLESRGREYHERVRAGFLQEANRQSEKIRVVDATGDVDSIQRRVREMVTTKLSS